MKIKMAPLCIYRLKSNVVLIEYVYARILFECKYSVIIKCQIEFRILIMHIKIFLLSIYCFYLNTNLIFSLIEFDTSESSIVKLRKELVSADLRIKQALKTINSLKKHPLLSSSLHHLRKRQVIDHINDHQLNNDKPCVCQDGLPGLNGAPGLSGVPGARGAKGWWERNLHAILKKNIQLI